MARARSFADVCALIERAEEVLIEKGGITDALQRVITLRGVYYGTPWCVDFRAMRSQFRNLGFTLFTGFGLPPDPRPVLGPSLFADLQASQDVRDRDFALDVGHALIGMEARGNPITRAFPIPTQGGTGLEIVTWLGDLGGGAANLAWQRSAGGRNVTRSVSTVFVESGSDYGASINLEGDVAGYLIGAGSSLAAPNFPPGAKIADLFRDYLPVSPTGTARYTRRCRDFLTIMGGSLDSSPKARLMNRAAVASAFARRIREFGGPYMLLHYILGQGAPPSRVEQACKLLDGAAIEVAEVFVSTLERSVPNPRRAIAARPPWPAASPPAASCTAVALAAAAREGDVRDTINRALRDGRRSAWEWLRQIDSAIE
jgi:hypothetical protein